MKDYNITKLLERLNNLTLFVSVLKETIEARESELGSQIDFLDGHGYSEFTRAQWSAKELSTRLDDAENNLGGEIEDALDHLRGLEREIDDIEINYFHLSN